MVLIAIAVVSIFLVRIFRRFAFNAKPQQLALIWTDIVGLWLLSLMVVMPVPAAWQVYKQSHSVSQAAWIWSMLALYSAVMFAGLGYLIACLVDLVTGGPWRRSKHRAAIST